MDPKAFYKKLDSTKFPKYFQMGTVVEGAADFYSGEGGRATRGDKGCGGRGMWVARGVAVGVRAAAYLPACSRPACRRAPDQQAAQAHLHRGSHGRPAAGRGGRLAGTDVVVRCRVLGWCCSHGLDHSCVPLCRAPLPAPQVRKRRFGKLQEERSYWSKKKHGRKTGDDRKKRAHHRPKH